MPPETESGRVPPADLEAERSVLGCILLDNQVVYTAIEHLSSASFYQEGHRMIFSAMLDLADRTQPIDLVTLAARLESEGTLEAVGGRVYLASLSDSVPTAASAAHYCRIVREKAVLRDLISTATDIVRDCYSSPGEADVMLDDAERRIFALSEKRIRAGFFSLKELVKGGFKSIEQLYERKEHITGVPTGFRDLDDLTSGLQRSDLIVVAGRPGMGKTALCLNIAQHVAIRAKRPVGIFSLEMNKEQLVTRLLCSEARIDAHRLRSGYLGDADWPKLTRAAGTLSEAPIAIDDSPALTVLEMRAKARRLKAEKGLDLLIVDYLQLMRGRGSADSREQEISEISRSLKALAKELSIPVIALSQLNRAVESRERKQPMLADLRESGAIEQDADVIIFIYREEIYLRDKTPPEKKGVAEIIVGKQRNGPTGTVKLTWLDKFTRFEDYIERSHVGSAMG